MLFHYAIAPAMAEDRAFTMIGFQDQDELAGFNVLTHSPDASGQAGSGQNPAACLGDRPDLDRHVVVGLPRPPLTPARGAGPAGDLQADGRCVARRRGLPCTRTWRSSPSAMTALRSPHKSRRRDPVLGGDSSPKLQRSAMPVRSPRSAA